MKTTANVVFIQDGRVLLLFKKSAWILPGGKHEEGETDIQCVLRECREEIPDAEVMIGFPLGTFEGITPNSGTSVRATVFLGKISGNTSASAEVSESRWFTKAELSTNPISDTTMKILQTITF